MPKNAQKLPKWPKTTKNAQNLPKLAEIAKNYQNGQNYLKWPNINKMA